jgi:hypothetical protein
VVSHAIEHRRQRRQVPLAPCDSQRLRGQHFAGQGRGPEFLVQAAKFSQSRLGASILLPGIWRDSTCRCLVGIILKFSSFLLTCDIRKICALYLHYCFL